MVSITYTLLFILWVNRIRGESSLNFNLTEEEEHEGGSSQVNRDQEPAYPQPNLEDAVHNTTTNDLNNDLICDGGGYAVYENGTFINGTASCDEPATYCCMAEEGEVEAESRQSISGADALFNQTNITNVTQQYFPPCDGFTGVICHGTADKPNCKGEEACRNSTIGLIQDGSCQGTHACKDTIIESVSTKSCVGKNSCSEAKIGTVAESSCRGSTACHRSKIGTVMEESCVADREACAGGTIDHVSQGSCQQPKACSASFLGTVRGGSCRGHFSCGAQYFETTLTVLDYVDQSCIGPHACHRATIRKLTLGSCVGNFPCGTYYGSSIHIDSVQNRSCVGNFVCMDANMGIVKDMSCIGRGACKKTNIGNLSDNSCFGDLSCQGAKITSATQSCYGNSSCQEFFVNGTLSNSCQDPWMCVSRDHKGDLKDSCRGPLETPFPPPCSRGTSSRQYYGTAFVMMVMTAMKLLFG